MFNSYADSKDWNDLVHALTESLKHPFPDEMVLLLHKAIPSRHGRWSEHVFTVTYDSLDEVPELLLSKAPRAVRAGGPRAQEQQQRIESHDEQRQPTPTETSREEIVESKEAEVDRPDPHREQEFTEDQADASKLTQDAYRHDFEQNRAAAAQKIQAAYRRHLQRKEVARRGVDEVQARYWRLLRQSSREMEWSKDSRYYILFRVPLADILVCLDTIGSFFQSGKKEANKRMGGAQQKDYHELIEVSNRYRYDRILTARHPRGLTNPLGIS